MTRPLRAARCCMRHAVMQSPANPHGVVICPFPYDIADRAHSVSTVHFVAHVAFEYVAARRQVRESCVQ
jgi:hypothetical protein